jgi:hypothetical protein
MTGICVCCRTWFTIRRLTGLVRNHRDIRGNLCAGSGRPPEIEEFA